MHIKHQVLVDMSMNRVSLTIFITDLEHKLLRLYKPMSLAFLISSCGGTAIRIATKAMQAIDLLRLLLW